MNIGGPEILISILIVLPLAFVAWGVIDALLHPGWAWRQAGKSKVFWIVLQVGGLLFFGVGGLLMAIVYLAAVRPEVVQTQAERQGR
jgi:hypothetical protein